MSMQEHRKWVIGAFAAMALTMAGLFVWGAIRGVMRAGVTPEDARTARDLASQKEIAAALKDPVRRDEAVRALREWKDVAAVDILVALGHKSEDPEVRAAALTALGNLVDPGDMQSVHILTIGSRDEAPVVRMAALRALGQVATDAAYAAVADALEDIEPSVCRTAAEVLSAGKGSSTTVEKLAAAFGEEEDVETRRFVALALGRTKDDPARRCLLSAIGRTGESPPTVRLAAVESLAAWNDACGAEGLVVGMCDPDDAVRGRAEALFAQLDATALTNLTAALGEGGARNALARGDRAASALNRVLDALGAMGTVETAEGTVRALDIAVGAGKTPAHPEVLKRAVAHLVGLGEGALPAIEAAALRPDTRLSLKTACGDALAGVGAAAVGPINRYIESRKVLPSREESRLWAAILDRIGGAEAAEAAVEARARDPEEVFRRYAEALPPLSTNRPPAPQIGEWSLVLYKGMYAGNPPSAYTARRNNLPFLKNRSVEEADIPEYRPTEGCDIALDLVRTRDGWARCQGHSHMFNHVVFGKVDRLEMTDEAAEGEVRVNVYRDPWMLGGYGEYRVSLRRQADGRYRGTYKGRFRDVPIEGTAVCVEKPKREALPAGFRPVAPDEHPRLLFRKHELPALRARLATPFGQAAFRSMATAGVRGGEAVSGHVELGMLYQLTGDARYAQAAIPAVERAMEERDFGFMGLGQIWGPRWSDIAYAYDLCYDAWPTQFRAKVARYMLRAVQDAAFNMGKFSSCANSHPCSNYYSPIVGGASMLALALWMEPGGMPLPLGDTQLIEPAPLAARPDAGAPVVPLRSGEPFGHWLWAGPVYLPVSAEELAESAAGDASGAVREGKVLKVDGREYTFHQPPDEVRQSGDIYPWPYVRQENPDCTAVGMVLYTVLENVRAGYYKAELPKQGSTHCVLGGLRIPDGAHVRLEAGLYPLLIAFSGDPSMVVPVGARLRFLTDSRKEVDTILTLAAQKAKGERMVYELDLADHEATGMDGEKINAVNRTFDLMVRGHRLLFGTGGYQSEGEMYHHTAITPVQYAAACWNVFGQTLTPYADARLSVARFLSHGLLDEGKGGTAALVWQSFNGGNYNGTPPGFIRAGFRFTPEEYKPALLWLWNRMAGVDEDDPESYVRLLAGADVVQTFVNYPLDPKTGLCSIKPRHPDEAFPKTWQCEDKGLYVFRNRWRDQGDIVLQVYANQLMSKGHGQPDAGGVRLHGLGYDWTNDSPGKGNPYRWLQNVVVLPPDLGMDRATGVATAWRGETNGSGRVSIDMSLVYKGVRGHSAVGIWPPDPIPPGEVRGLRAVAADYSGKCGAPALFVFVDKVEGGPDRFWLWNPPTGGGKRVKDTSAKDLRVETGANTFTIHQDQASLRAVFVAPGDAEVKSPGTIHVRDFSTDEATVLMKKDRNYKPDPSPMAVPIAVKAAPGESFFAVMTLQEGPAPEVKVVRGAGLDAVVQVGERQIRFDGENVAIEDVAADTPKAEAAK